MCDWQKCIQHKAMELCIMHFNLSVSTDWCGLNSTRTDLFTVSIQLPTMVFGCSELDKKYPGGKIYCYTDSMFSPFTVNTVHLCDKLSTQVGSVLHICVEENITCCLT